jgi:hypothetical protein
MQNEWLLHGKKPVALHDLLAVVELMTQPS